MGESPPSIAPASTTEIGVPGFHNSPTKIVGNPSFAGSSVKRVRSVGGAPSLWMKIS
jgi:hypothetical protein